MAAAPQPSCQDMDDAAQLLMMRAHGTQRSHFSPAADPPDPSATSAIDQAQSSPVPRGAGADTAAVEQGPTVDMSDDEVSQANMSDDEASEASDGCHAEPSQSLAEPSQLPREPAARSSVPISSQSKSHEGSVSSHSASSGSSSGRSLFDNTYVLSKFHQLAGHLASKRSAEGSHSRKRQATVENVGASSAASTKAELRWSIISKMGQLLEGGDEIALEKLEQSLEAVDMTQD